MAQETVGLRLVVRIPNRGEVRWDLPDGSRMITYITESEYLAMPQGGAEKAAWEAAHKPSANAVFNSAALQEQYNTASGSLEPGDITSAFANLIEDPVYKLCIPGVGDFDLPLGTPAFTVNGVPPLINVTQDLFSNPRVRITDGTIIIDPS